MPNWVKHMLWAFLVILLLARWRDVAGWIRNLGSSFAALSSGGALRPHDPVYGFAVLGLLIVMVVALWAIYWNNRSKGSP